MIQLGGRCCIIFRFEFGILMKLARLTKMYLNETYIIAQVGKNLFDTYLINHVFKEGDVLSSMVLNFFLGCAITIAKAN